MGCAALAVMALLLPGPTVRGAVVSRDQQAAVLRATVRVTAGDGSGFVGTAVCIAQRDGSSYLLTAAHVVPAGEARAYEVFTDESYPRPARTLLDGDILLRLPGPDIAVVQLSTGLDPIPVAPLPAPGNRPKRFPFAAVSLGCPDFAPPTARPEKVVGRKLVRKNPEAFFWEMESRPIGGMSGGPLLGPDGQIIGLCTAAQGDHGYFAYLDEIQAGLKRGGLSWLVPAR